MATLYILLNFSVNLKLEKKSIKNNKMPGSFSNRGNIQQKTGAAWNRHEDSNMLAQGQGQHQRGPCPRTGVERTLWPLIPKKLA